MGHDARTTPRKPDEVRARFDEIKASGGEPRYYMRMGKVRVRDISKALARRNNAMAARKTALVDQVAAMVAEREASGEGYTEFAERLIAIIKRKRR